jgi:hypothetical protein
MRAPAQLVLGYLDCPRTQWMSRLSERSPCPEKRRSRKYWYYKTGELGDVVMKLGFFPTLTSYNSVLLQRNHAYEKTLVPSLAQSALACLGLFAARQWRV